MSTVDGWTPEDERVVAAVHAAYRTKGIAAERGFWNLRPGPGDWLERAKQCRGFCVQGALLLGTVLAQRPPEVMEAGATRFDWTAARMLEIPVTYAMGMRIGFDVPEPPCSTVLAIAELDPAYRRGLDVGRRLGRELAPQRQPCVCGHC